MEIRLADPLDLRRQRECRLGDRERAAFPRESDGRVGLEVTILLARFGQHKAKRHGKAGSVRGCGQFLRVGAGRFAEAGVEVVELVGQDPGLGREAQNLDSLVTITA